MPLALSFMGSLLGGGARADLVVGAVAAALVFGGGLELAVADAAGRVLDGLARGLEVLQRRHVAAGQARLQEAQLHAGGQPAGHLVLGQRVDLELQALARALVGLLLVGHVARLVVDDDEALGGLVDAVEAAAHAVEAEVEAELALHLGGLLPRGLLLVVEAGQRRDARALALLLMLAGEEALVPPRLVEREQEVLEGGVVAGGATAQVELDRVV